MRHFDFTYYAHIVCDPTQSDCLPDMFRCVQVELSPMIMEYLILKHGIRDFSLAKQHQTFDVRTVAFSGIFNGGICPPVVIIITNFVLFKKIIYLLASHYNKKSNFLGFFAISSTIYFLSLCALISNLLRSLY